MDQKRYHWAASGDVNAFFGLMLDNIAGLLLLVSVLYGAFQFPVEFSLRYMVPGTAIGVLVGDLLFFALAFVYAKKTGRQNVTAMPLGLDTPSTFGMVLLVIGPAYSAALAALLADAGLSADAVTPEITHAAAMTAWKIGMCAIFITGVVKGIMAFFSGWIHKVFPRAGLLGSLAAIAVVLISFSQMPELARNPIVGFASFAVVLATLIARQALPFKIPGALGAVLVGTALAYMLYGVDYVGQFGITAPAEMTEVVWFPTEWMTALKFEWLSQETFAQTLPFLGFIIPFALATVIGGIDCAESAASVGDKFNTGTVIGIEAFATLIAACCGGVIQTTPYIGHPAYKAMGGRAAYTLATALFVGGAGLIGYFSLMFVFVPKEAVLPILLFIGIEITAQSYHATPRRHYAALAVACFPAIAKMIVIFIGQFKGVFNFETAPDFAVASAESLMLRLNVLAGGFILTSLIWASATARIIDRRFSLAAVYFAVGGLLTMFGLMHSPIDDDKMFLPWQLFDTDFASVAQRNISVQFAVAYLVMAVLMVGLEMLLKDKLKVINSDEEYEKLQ